MTIWKIKYELKVRPPLHIGSGVLRGNIHETKKYIPGNTIRGLVGLSLLKLICDNGDCNKCDPDCPYVILISHDSYQGAYFNFIYVNGTVELIPKVRISRNYKVCSEESLFFYEAIFPENGRYFLLSSSIFAYTEKEHAKWVCKALKATKGMGIGGRRSWGWGHVEDVKIKSIEKIKLELNDYIGNLTLKVKTPLPIPRGLKGVKETIKYIVEEFYNKKEINIKVKFSRFDVENISYWNEREKKGFTTFALSPGTKIKIENCFDISPITSVFGLSDLGYWFSKCGYGICQKIWFN